MRSSPTFDESPSAATIRAARERAGYTQTQAAQLVRSSMRAWQEWERGTNAMPPGLWELFAIKVLFQSFAHEDWLGQARDSFEQF